ncbi:hypothetical protein CYMTET_28958 [Cymbomonas tetramitiformis]|uniref:Cux N-terminal domain-containing protein n=1 Tax=Cymbomonas tetramitiformis TaxID=36881 RepID=A0AAE0FLX7_9CHLO|nr:hypothetical protein CYMTET_28958 [Cymbomonas tetramitiformis]
MPGTLSAPVAATAEAVIDFWKDFDFEATRSGWDADALKIAENQENSAANRRKLMEATRDFKKTPESDRTDQVLPLLKSYQEEVDNLTKRGKLAENAFLTIFQKLYDAPDPAHALLNSADNSARLQDLEQDSAKLQRELEEYREESGKLKNQEVTVRRLDERNRALEAQVRGGGRGGREAQGKRGGRESQAESQVAEAGGAAGNQVRREEGRESQGGRGGRESQVADAEGRPGSPVGGGGGRLWEAQRRREGEAESSGRGGGIGRESQEVQGGWRPESGREAQGGGGRSQGGGVRRPGSGEAGGEAEVRGGGGRGGRSLGGRGRRPKLQAEAGGGQVRWGGGGRGGRSLWVEAGGEAGSLWAEAGGEAGKSWWAEAGGEARIPVEEA